MNGVTFFSPATVQETAELLNSYQNVGIIAGGTDLVPLYNLREKKPQTNLVYIGKIDALKEVKVENNALVIGALTTFSELEQNPLVKKYAPALADAAYQMGTPQVRNQGTIGGNIVNASPAADGAVALLAEAAVVTIVSASGERKVNLEEFFLDKGKVDLKNDELVTGVEIPLTDGITKKGVHLRSQQRRGSSLALVSIAVSADFKDNQCLGVRVSGGALAPKPLRCRETEQAIGNGTAVDMKNVYDKLAAEISPIDDARAAAWYRTEVAQVLVKRALERVLNQA